MRSQRLTVALFAGALVAVPSVGHAQTKLMVAMPTSPPNIVHMPIYIAKDLGLFKKAGVEIDTIALEGGVKTYRAMVAGNADIASASGPFSIVGRAKGAMTKMILASAPKLEASMVVDKSIKTLADLKGKRIGIQQPGGFADVLSRGVLRAAKVNPRDVSFVSIASEDVPALVAGQVDTAILHVEQEMVAQSKVPSLHAIARLWEIQPKNLYNVMVVSDKTIHDKRVALQAFVKGHIEGTRLMYTDKAKVLPIIMKYTEQPKEIAEKAYDLMVKNCIWDADHGLTHDSVDYTTNLMVRVGNIEKGKAPKYDDVVDLSFAKEAIKELGEWKGPVCPSPDAAH
jgi:ABC-type nitrate/sulfonate/bicarbonate transport system substrate-binding protein